LYPLIKIKIRVQAPPQRGSAPAGGPGFDYPQRGFSLPAFNNLRSTGVLEWWSNGRNLFFHRSQKTDLWKKSESLKLFF